MIEKMFALDKAFMFRFEADTGQPLNENHKVIPTFKALKRLGQPAIQEIVRHFLSLDHIKWEAFDPKAMKFLAIYHPKTHGETIGISPSIITNKNESRKVIWILTDEDIFEINGIVPEGNSRARIPNAPQSRN